MSRVTIFRSEVSYNSSLAWGGIRSGSGIGLLFADDVRGNCVCHGVRCQRLPSCVTKLRQNRRSYESRMVVIFYQNTSNLLCNSNTHWMVGYLWVAWLLCECYLWSFWSIFSSRFEGTWNTPCSVLPAVQTMRRWDSTHRPLDSIFDSWNSDAETSSVILQYMCGVCLAQRRCRNMKFSVKNATCLWL